MQTCNYVWAESTWNWRFLILNYFSNHWCRTFRPKGHHRKLPHFFSEWIQFQSIPSFVRQHFCLYVCRDRWLPLNVSCAAVSLCSTLKSAPHSCDRSSSNDITGHQKYQFFIRYVSRYLVPTFYLWTNVNLIYYKLCFAFFLTWQLLDW
jgi:hypothetical protein